MIVFRQLEQDDSESLYMLINDIECSLPDATWWLPIKKTAQEHFFDKSWTIFYGAFDKDKLVAASGLFINPYEYAECAIQLGLNLDKTAEIGRCMVLPDYRGHNLMFMLNKLLIEEALKLDRSTIIATAHPNNISSNKSLIKLGMSIKGEIVKMDSYPRNILVMHLT